jgi:hypothetical protein
VIAPEKASIYPELMPDGWVRRPGKHRLEQLQEQLRKTTNVEFVDAEAILLAQKKNGHALYHPNDSHWNDYGSFLVAQEMLAHLHKFFPSVQPFTSGQYCLAKGKTEGDLARLLGLQTDMLDTISPRVCLREPHAVKNLQAQLPAIGDNTSSLYELLDSKNAPENASDLPRAFFLHDSFAYNLQPYLAEKFKSSEFFVCHELIPNVVLKERPDVVVEELAERHLTDREVENVPAFLHLLDGQGRPASKICSFGDTVELIEAAVTHSDAGLAVNLIWHAKAATKLDALVCLHALDATCRQELGTFGYVQDFLKRDVAAGQYWLDRVEIADRRAINAQQLGIVVSRADGTQLVCDAPNNLYRVCLLTPVANAMISDSFGSSFVAERKPNPLEKL